MNNDISLREIATSRLNERANAEIPNTRRTLGKKLTKATEGDGLFLVVDEANAGNPQWPKLSFFNFSKRKLTDKEGDH